MPTSSKKKRRSSPQAGDDDVVEETSNENFENGDEFRRNSRDKRPKFDDAEEDDEMEEAPPSPMQNPNSNHPDVNSPIRDRHTNPTGKPAEAGIIHEVYVENFMCHRKLTVQLCRNVNFIHGQNGSGKSAILAAIQVCLGANAKRTHRARNLKDLVRKEAGVGCTGAKLRVTLLNRGSDGYQPEVYGDYITVERSISLGGGYNGFKLLDSTGKERSRNKKDLYAMLDQLNIQVDNPVAVLDQEEAKKFLTGKEEDKYQFFTKATELERLDRTYASIQDNIEEQKEARDRALSALEGTRENAKRLKKEWEQFQELDKLEAECQQARAMCGWAIHAEFSQELEAELKSRAKLQKNLEKRQGELREAEDAVNVTDDEEIAAKNRLQELIVESTDAANYKIQLEQELKRATQPLKQKEREHQIIEKELASAKKRLKSAQFRLEKARKEVIESAGNAAEEERVRTRKIAQLESDIAHGKPKLDPLKERIADELRRYQEMEPEEGQKKEVREATERQLHAVQRKVKDLQNEAGGGDKSLAVFGPKCKAMHELVQKAIKSKQFKGPVAGPVGMYLKIQNGKEKYAKIAEVAIGPGHLDRFIVTDKYDMELMKKFRKNIGCSPRDCSIYQIHPRATKEKYSTPAPPEGVETVTSVLSIENVMAFNYLVDNCKIDESALADSKEDSERALLVSDSSGRESIRGKVKKVFFMPNGDHWEAKGGSRMMVSHDRPLKQTIGVDRSRAIDAGKIEIRGLEQELARNRKEEEAVKDALLELRKAWNHSRKEYQSLQKKIKDKEADLGNLKAEAETSEEVPTIDTSEMEADIHEAEEALEDIKKRETSILEEIDALHPTVEEHKRRLDEVAARNVKVMDDLEEAEHKVEDIVKGRNRREENVEKLRVKVQQCEETLRQQQVLIDNHEEKVSKALHGARRMHFFYVREKNKLDCGGDAEGGDEEANREPTDEELEEIEPVCPEKDSKHYKAKLVAKQKKIETERSRRSITELDPAVAREKYLRAKQDLDSKMEQINAIDQATTALEIDLRERKKRWRQFRSHIAQMTNLSFDEFLGKKGSSGVIEFDHDHGRLNLIVQKDQNDQGSQTKDVKALSGGERSFTTLALLLAIGESLETPFRVMDEFDVFLDPLARKIALKTLITTAKEMEHRQFIFITPQDLSSLKTDPKLKIFQMRPPARNAYVGGPQQQTLDFDNH
ncbi:hypothetical protein HJC23_005559 [Cyclotella cryptica]|uniref:RecF/RecN/SMC N-terminal domain-containing protein n=1 Tax=Cyclotella cryptica TaxID=29204 RepID=A0ABD3PY26_9STRA